MGESLGRDDPKFPPGRVAGQHRRTVRTGSPSALSRYCPYYQAFTGVIHLRMVHLIICGTGERWDAFLRDMTGASRYCCPPVWKITCRRTPPSASLMPSSKTIGRASCGARLCQSVYITVVAGPL